MNKIFQNNLHMQLLFVQKDADSNPALTAPTPKQLLQCPASTKELLPMALHDYGLHELLGPQCLLGILHIADFCLAQSNQFR